jgi:hypothetical protein
VSQVWNYHVYCQERGRRQYDFVQLPEQFHNGPHEGGIFLRLIEVLDRMQYHLWVIFHAVYRHPQKL